MGFEPFWETGVAVSLAGLGAAPPPARENTEAIAEPALAAARGPAVVAAEPAPPPIREAALTAELVAFAELAVFAGLVVFAEPVAFGILHPCCRRRLLLSELISESCRNGCTAH